MDVGFMILIFLSALLLLMSTSATVLETMHANQALKDGDTIVSDGEMFELGFFSPGKSKYRYLGIWYKKISTGTVVWVANRETPVTDKLGTFKVSVEGTPLIHSGDGTLIWSSNSTGVSVRSNSPLLVVVQLLDTGNLVVWDNSSKRQSQIWQSFDYPGNTLLPGMKFGKDLITGRNRVIRPWKSLDDPSPGSYLHWLDTNGYPQIFGKQGSDLHWRFGPWNGLKFQGLSLENPNQIYSLEFVCNEKEVYSKYELKTSAVQRIIVTPDDSTFHLHWIDQIQDWAVYSISSSTESCGRYGLCGPYGSCSINRYPPCQCMEGFTPKFPDEWDRANGSRGCQRKKALDCGSEDGFRRISGLIYPDTQRSWYNHSMSLGECEIACEMNCNCTAYANSDIRNGGSGCLLWFDELLDIKEYNEKQHFYLKLAASELAGNKVPQSSFIRKKGVLTVILSTSSAMLILCSVAYAYLKKKKRPQMKGKGKWSGLDKKNNSFLMKVLDELPFYSLKEILKATNNFSINNKIGEGGFGPVYRGVLEDRQEVAIKRLSERSHQGLDEFKNEIICIANLQHRNLMKLLGYCIHGKDMILIYEYMINRSLDTFLFDETRSSTLDWAHRFNIINGIARGILYLHQDSRLQIIHRDLKVGNILLDGDMNPKISDFGLARKFVGFDTTAKTKKVVGTHGYISPEYAVYGRFSIKSDVFSFGVMVLEIVSGKKNLEFSHEDHNDNLLGHAWRLYQEDKSYELVSASLRDSLVISEVLRSIHVALLCVQHHAEDRPTMLSVVLMLVSEGVLPQPKQPTFFTEESSSKHASVLSVDENMTTLLYAR